MKLLLFRVNVISILKQVSVGSEIRPFHASRTSESTETPWCLRC